MCLGGLWSSKFVPPTHETQPLKGVKWRNNLPRFLGVPSNLDVFFPSSSSCLLWFSLFVAPKSSAKKTQWGYLQKEQKHSKTQRKRSDPQGFGYIWIIWIYLYVHNDITVAAFHHFCPEQKTTTDAWEGWSFRLWEGWELTHTGKLETHKLRCCFTGFYFGIFGGFQLFLNHSQYGSCMDGVLEKVNLQNVTIWGIHDPCSLFPRGASRCRLPKMHFQVNLSSLCLHHRPWDMPGHLWNSTPDVSLFRENLRINGGFTGVWIISDKQDKKIQNSFAVAKKRTYFVTLTDKYILHTYVCVYSMYFVQSRWLYTRTHIWILLGRS